MATLSSETHAGSFRSTILVGCALLCAGWNLAGAPATTGQIGAARFTISLPATNWNGSVLLLAHGFRPDGAPQLADLEESNPQFIALRNSGWLVASTSFRRNGMIIRDAIDDLDQLRDHIAKVHGQPKRVFVQGESMGGTIATLMAERSPGRYAGFLAIGAALEAEDPGNPLKPSGAPRIPLLFLSNRSEVDGPSAYSTKVTEEPKPVLWRVDRDGHVNVNSAERAQALTALVAWAAGARPSPGAVATVPPKPGASTAKRILGRRAEGSITKVNPFYGNLTTSLLAADLESAGVKARSRFNRTLGAQTVSVLYGSDFGDVPKGEWVAFVDAEGFVFISKNWDNAAKATGVKTGDPVKVDR